MLILHTGYEFEEIQNILTSIQNNRYLNTNNRKVLQVSTFFEKRERNKDRLLKGYFPSDGPLYDGPRRSPFGCGPELIARESIGDLLAGPPR